MKTDNEIENYEEKFIHEKEKKISWWGDGEWVLEPDYVGFVYKNYQCEIRRIVVGNNCNSKYIFGGHLCGYVQVPNELNLIDKDFDLDFDVRNLLIYSKQNLKRK